MRINPVYRDCVICNTAFSTLNIRKKTCGSRECHFRFAIQVRSSKVIKKKVEEVFLENGLGATKIELTQGKWAIIDKELLGEITKFNWYYKTDRSPYQGYAIRTIPNSKPKRVIAMHRQILGIASKPQVYGDHINGDTLDNRRENLRIASISQNSMNRRLLRSDNTTGFRGVYLHKNLKEHRNRYQAKIFVNNHGLSLGYFKTPEEAAHAYDQAAKKYFGDFAKLNFL